jgi:hypothetical protein
MKTSDNHIPCMLKTKGRSSYKNLLSSNTCFSHSSILLALTLLKVSFTVKSVQTCLLIRKLTLAALKV